VKSEHKQTETKTLEIGKTVSELDNQIWKIFQDSKGKYWFGSNGKGIYYLDGNKLKLFTTIDGLVNNTIRGIQEDINGNIYIETPEGISKFDGIEFTTLKAIKSLIINGNLNQMTCGLVTMHTIYIVMMEILFLN
jgi:ligand-binding sensor domain-containing protein